MIRIRKFENGKREYWTLQSKDAGLIRAIRYSFNISASVRRLPYSVEIARRQRENGERFYLATAYYRTGYSTQPHTIKTESLCPRDSLKQLLGLCVEFSNVGLSKIQRATYAQQHEKIMLLMALP
jgi:hypothetical protein